MNSYRSGPPGSRGDLKSTFTLCDAMPTVISSGVAAGNEAWPWHPANNIDITLQRRDPRQPVSSLLSAMVGNRPDLSLSPARSGYSRPAQTGGRTGTEGQDTTIATRVASSARRRPVDRGRAAIPQIFAVGWSKKQVTLSRQGREERY